MPSRLCSLNRLHRTFQTFSNAIRISSITILLVALFHSASNGGFLQYFLNDSCETAVFVAKALDTIGAPRTADICRRNVEWAMNQVEKYCNCDKDAARVAAELAAAAALIARAGPYLEYVAAF